MSQSIDLSAGAIEYSWPLTIIEITGKDISADPIVLSLGSFTEVGEWRTPDVDEPQTDHSQRVVQLLIGAALVPIPGEYWLWSKVTDSPETVPRRHARLTIT